MLRLMQKNSLFFAIQAFLLLMLITVYWLCARDMLSWSMVLFQGQILILIILSSIASNEQQEEKSKGYAFLSILPVTDRDIVASKFACVLLTVSFIVAYNNFLFTLFPDPAYLASFGRIFVLLSGLACLILAGLMYIIIYLWGHRFIKIVWITALANVILPILFVELVLLKRNIDLRNLFNAITKVSRAVWILLALISVVLFLLLLQAAVQAKARQREAH